MTIRHGRVGSIAIVTASGHYDVADLRAGLEAAVSAFGADGAAGLLFDLSASEALGDRPTEDVRAMAYFIASRSDAFGRRVAMVTGSEVAYGLMRLGATVAESQGIAARVFRDYDVAMGWLTSGEV
jgi:hypothetical protein